MKINIRRYIHILGYRYVLCVEKEDRMIDITLKDMVDFFNINVNDIFKKAEEFGMVDYLYFKKEDNANKMANFLNTKIFMNRLGE